MSGKDKPKSRSKSRSKEYSDKSQKKDEGSKMQISLKETKEKKSVTKKEQKDNKNIDKKEFQRLAKKNEVKMDENAMMMMMMMTDIEKNLPISNSIDKMKQSLSSGSKLLTVNSTSTTKKYPEKIIVNKLEKLKSRKKSCEKLGKHEAKYIPKISDDKVQKLKSDKSSSNCITDNSIDKAGRSSLSVKCSKSTYQNLHTSKLPPPTCAKILPAVPLSHIDEYDYEDDFEDYSDDFEEESENESSDRESTEGRGKKSEQNSAVSRNLTISRIGGTSNRDSLIDATINESYENSPLLHRIMNRSRSDDNVQPLQMQSIHFHGCTQRKIDFANATTTINWEKMSEVERRYKMLKNLIGMEIVQFDLLDHQVIRAYDFYVQMFGNANYIQVQTQTGDDKLNCYVQTEEMDKETVWTQIPYSDPQGWGIANISDGIDYCERFGSEIEHSKISHFEMTKFCKFISIAGQVFIDIMQSSSNCATQPSLEYRASLKFSTGYNKFSLGNLVNSSKVTSMLHRENQLFIAFYVEQTSNDDIINRSIIVEFDICSPHNPKKILLCHNEVRCFCMSPDDARAVFVGLNDGSCLAYDLRESNSLFPIKLLWDENGKMYPLRTAAYDTSFKALSNKMLNECHQFAIVAISNVHSNVNSSETYQLVSVDEYGIVIVWTVITEEQSIRINDHDLGQRPGAKLKMIQTSVIRLDSILFSNLNLSQKTTVNCMTMVPTNRAQFLLGTNRGIVTSFVSIKAIKFIGPRMYRNDFEMATEVVFISFSSESTFFSIGFSSGHISLCEISNAQPILTLEPPERNRKPLLRVFFSSTNPTVLYAIHSHGLLLTWDLAKSRKPEFVDDLNLKDDCEVTTAELWQYVVASTNPCINLLAIGFSNGEVQLHGLSKSSSNRDDRKRNKSLSNAIKAFNDL